MSNQTLIAPPTLPEPGPVYAEKAQAPGRPEWHKLVGLIALVLLANAPLLFLHLKNLLARPYYDFVYLLPVGMWLMYRRYGGISERPAAPPQTIKAFTGLGLSAILCAGAVYLWSPWLAAVGILVSIPALTYALWGANRVRAIAPAWLLGWLLIPPPLVYGKLLTESLRSAATICASRILDSFGILHLTEGNVITTAKGSLFVADACSGVNSLYSLLALALFYCLWNRRHWFHTLLLLGIVVPIVLLENAARISVIPFCLHAFDIDLSLGWKHLVLGLVLFLLSGLLLASFDQLLSFLAPLVIAFRDLLWRRRPAHVDERHKRSAQFNSLVRLATTTCVVLLVLGGLVQFAVFAKTADYRPSWQTRKIDVSRIEASALPPEWNGWRQTDYEEITRAVEDPFGNWSKTWTYTRGAQVAKFSLDYAWPDPHDLAVCYRATGWATSPAAIGEDPSGLPFVAMTLQKKLHANSVLLFSLHNLHGDTAVEFAENNRLTNKFVRREKSGPWYQVQLLATGVSGDSENASKELEALFGEFRQMVITKVER